MVLLKGNLQPPTLVVDGGGRLPGRNDDEVDLRTGGRQNKKKECFHSLYCCSTLFCLVHTPHISMLFDLFHVIKKLCRYTQLERILEYRQEIQEGK